MVYIGGQQRSAIHTSVCCIYFASGAGKLTYCAFIDNSTNFGTEVDKYVINKFGGGATAELPLAAVAAIFHNGRQQTYNRHQKVNIKSPAECFEPIRARYYQDSS